MCILFKKQKTIAVILSILMIASIFGSFPAKSFAESGWDGISQDITWYEGHETDSSFTITSSEQLAGLAAITDGTAKGVAQSDFSDKKIVLGNDIDLGNNNWEPIGKAAVTETGGFEISESSSFNGTFDGNGKTISNLKMNQITSGLALFAYTGKDSLIENLTVDGQVEGAYHTAGLISICAGDVTNVTNKATVSGTNDYVAGIASEIKGNSQLTNCKNEGNISNSSKTKSSGRLAGIVGAVDYGSTADIKECANRGDIEGYQYVAGIIGGQYGAADIKACYNTGNITGISFGKVYLGGIAGKSEGGTITNCYNTGTLTDKHWAAGHVRAIGGIAGCEEGREDGATAITKCYTTGIISIDTSKMIYGTNWIYEVGNISGGNSSTAENQMIYSGCHYLKNRINVANVSATGYQFWADSYKSNNLIWDTEKITANSETEMKAATFADEMGGAFYADTENANKGYPVLYWQAGQDYNETNYKIGNEIYGDKNATIEDVGNTAGVGDTVKFTVGNISGEKKVRSVSIKDVAGNKVQVINDSGKYSFLMPARDVKITVYVERETSSNDEYNINLPDNLDAIWELSFDSGYKSESKVKEGATVVVDITKAGAAMMTSLTGINVTVNGKKVTTSTYKYTKDSAGNGKYGQYAFTMPSGDVQIEPEISYSDFTLYQQEGTKGAATKVKSYTREDMNNLATDNLYYSGYASEEDALIGKADKGITITNLLKNAGVKIDKDSSLKITAADGMDMYYTYEMLYGSQRYYYPNIISGSNAIEKSAGRKEVDSMLVLKGNVAVGANENIENMKGDTFYAYRFVFGQTEKEFNNGQPAVEYKVNSSMPKCVKSITVIQNKKAVTPIAKHLKLKKTVVSLKAGNKRIYIKWRKITGAKGYQIYRATTKKGKYKTIKKVRTIKYTNIKLKKNKRYYYKVRAYGYEKGKIKYASCSYVKSKRTKK